jgi:hypothetical protein
MGRKMCKAKEGSKKWLTFTGKKDVKTIKTRNPKEEEEGDVGNH